MARHVVHPDSTSIPPKAQRWYAQLYLQVLTAIVAGIAVGHFYPQTGEAMKPLGDAFIKLVKMI